MPRLSGKAHLLPAVRVPECGSGPMSAGLGLRRRRRGYARNRREYREGYGRRWNGTGWAPGEPAGSGALNTFARLGFVARGIVYIVIGVIAIMVALGIARH